MIALITVAAGRHDHLQLQLEGLRHSSTKPDLHIVVAMADPQIRALCGQLSDVIDIALVDGRLPLAAARNAGAQRALQCDADDLIFLDVDCVPAPNFIGAMTNSLWGEASTSLLSGRVGYLPPPPRDGYQLHDLAANAHEHPLRGPRDATCNTVDHRLFWSLCFGLRAQTWTNIGGFDEGYTGYGGEDTDFSERARAQGIKHVMSSNSWAYHQWHPAQDPPLRHLDDILRNARRFHDRWAYWPMRGWLQAFADLGVVRRDRTVDDWIRC